MFWREASAAGWHKTSVIAVGPNNTNPASTQRHKCCRDRGVQHHRRRGLGEPRRPRSGRRQADPVLAVGPAVASQLPSGSRPKAGSWTIPARGEGFSEAQGLTGEVQRTSEQPDARLEAPRGSGAAAPTAEGSEVHTCPAACRSRELGGPCHRSSPDGPGQPSRSEKGQAGGEMLPRLTAVWRLNKPSS